ncbi:HDOD domain-containing protein [Marinobacter sp. M1N3S26]|uniref:HDOD domain-containing protein n=1 Tax=unclassified Marinobacter TaxID=83889 RepID=UPI00387AB255
MPGIVSWIRHRLFPSHSGHGAHSTMSAGSPHPTGSGLLNPGGADTPDCRPPRARLDDHLFCWLLDSTPRQIEQPSPLTSKVLQELDARLRDDALRELPRQPLTLPTLMRTLASDSTSRKEVTDIILSDASLTNQVLQVANSPFFKVSDHHVEDVDQAVFLLGLDGIRNVASASVMRPMLAARNSAESTFSQRVWRWGLTCARAAELIALNNRQESTSYFMVGLLPALSYLTLRREVQSIVEHRFPDQRPSPHILHEAMRRFEWATAQKIAHAWGLPSRYHALLLTAERPTPDQEHSPLNDGIILGTREVLRDAHQRNLGIDELQPLLSINEEQLDKIRQILSRLLSEGLSSR